MNLRLSFLSGASLIFFLSCISHQKDGRQIPEGGYSHFSIASLHEQEGRVEEAIREYEKALHYDPKSPLILESLIHLYLQVERYEDAFHLARRGIGIDSRIPLFHRVAGEFYSRRGEIQKAIREYKILRELEPLVSDHLYSLGHLYETLSESEKSLEYLMSFQEKNPQSPFSHYSLGNLYGKMREWEKATHEYERALELDPTFYQAYLGLGRIYEIRGDPEKALEHYQQVLQDDPENHMVKRHLIELYLQLKQNQKAMEVCEELLKTYPRDLDLLKMLGLFHLQEGELEKATEDFVHLTGYDPADREGHYYLGRIFYTQKLYGEALKQIKRTLEIDPRFGEAWVYLALISENFRDQASKVPEYLKKAEGQRPREKATQILLGTVYASRENFRSALRIYRRAVKIWRDDPELWYRLGTIQDRLKQFDETIYSMQRVIQLDPRFASAYNYMGYLFAEKGIRLEESLSLIEKALELEPENAYFIDSLGWVYFKLGKVDDARRELERAVSLLEDPVILEHLGDVYYALGRKEDAMKEWQKSLTLKADNASLIQKIQKIE